MVLRVSIGIQLIAVLYTKSGTKDSRKAFRKYLNAEQGVGLQKPQHCSMANEFLPLFSFRIPAFRNDVSFKQSFVSSIKESATTTFVTELDNARANMHNQLDQLKLDTVKPEPSLEAIGTYLPLIYTLSDAVNASPEEIPLQRRQVFEWRGALGELPNANRFHSSADMAFEIIMCLHARATLLHMTAKV